MTTLDRAALPRWLLMSVLACWLVEAKAEPNHQWALITSVYTTHFSHDSEHNENQALIGIERMDTDNTLWGAATFNNSFDQRSAFLFTGKRFDGARGPYFAKVMGGLLYGYRGEYQDKIPFNDLGVAPAIIPSVGIQVDAFKSEVLLLGTAALMVNLGWTF